MLERIINMLIIEMLLLYLLFKNWQNGNKSWYLPAVYIILGILIGGIIGGIVMACGQEEVGIVMLYTIIYIGEAIAIFSACIQYAETKKNK